MRQHYEITGNTTRIEKAVFTHKMTDLDEEEMSFCLRWNRVRVHAPFSEIIIVMSLDMEI